MIFTSDWPLIEDDDPPNLKTNHTDLSAATRGWNFHWSSSGSKVSLFMILFFSSGGMKFSMIRYLQEECMRISGSSGVWILSVFSYFEEIKKKQHDDVILSFRHFDIRCLGKSECFHLIYIKTFVFMIKHDKIGR